MNTNSPKSDNTFRHTAPKHATRPKRRDSVQTLIAAFCALNDFDNPEKIVEGKSFTKEEVEFSIKYEPQTVPARLSIHCDFGLAPTDREADVYRQLLLTNIYLYKGYSPTFAVLPDTRKVVLMVPRLADEMNAEELDALLATLAHQAKVWRKSYFLTHTPPVEKKMSRFSK